MRAHNWLDLEVHASHPTSARTIRITTLFLACLMLGKSAPLFARSLTFQDRVRAQEAIERVYYAHQIGASRPFEEAVPRRTIEEKVRRYLTESAALESFWSTPVTGDMLQKEIERMTRGTRLPGRLRELYKALNDDPVLILECLARPALVARLTRNFYAFDDRIHGESRREAERLRERLGRGEIDWRSAAFRGTLVELVREGAGAPEAVVRPPVGPPGPGIQGAETERLAPADFQHRLAGLPAAPGELSPVVEEPGGFAVTMMLEREPDRALIATYRVMKRPWDDWWASVQKRWLDAEPDVAVESAQVVPAPKWSGNSAELGAQVGCLPEDAWDRGALGGAPLPRREHTAVWTGSHMVIWGGYVAGFTNTGVRYDPATDTWLPVSTVDAPAARTRHTAVWTGEVMIVWGGFSSISPNYLNSGGRYDPVADTWLPTSTVDAPLGQDTHAAVWNGHVMIVWGGSSLGQGGRYNPASDTWVPVSAANAPMWRASPSAVWTGSRMIVWGGQAGNDLNTGGIYDPAADSWAPTSVSNAPTVRSRHTAVWTGSRMIVWGGVAGDQYRSDGALYDPSTDSWTPMNRFGPDARSGHTAVWTGSRMIVWGGFRSGVYLKDGSRYDPTTGTWAPTAVPSSLAARVGHSAVWTGSRMIVWGGASNAMAFNNGARYDPENDSWTPTSVANLPVAGPLRGVWTGSLLFAWYGPQPGMGGRYDPATDSWSPVSTVSAPSSRSNHTVVWTGSQVIVWGGNNSLGGSVFNTGGRYDPISDTWSPTSIIGAPASRQEHTAVWTGGRMIVWGGWYPGVSFYNSGGQYDPMTDTWTATLVTAAPTARRLHTAVWTGSRMIVWGGTGASGGSFEAGGVYDPAKDTWTVPSLDGAPGPRLGHSSVWTGDRMIVWGGRWVDLLDTGSLYDPVADSWHPMSLAGAPSQRHLHGAVWTGTRMIVWGGSSGTASLNTGGRYDPSSDTWTATSTIDAPAGGAPNVAVWTGDMMIVLTGPDGSRYTLGSHLDDDGDGYSECDGDCNDMTPTIHPGAPEVCNGIDDNCDGFKDEDADGDGRTACEDCAPADAGSFALPGEIMAVLIESDAMTIRWDASVPSAGTATVNDVARGSLSELPIGGGASETCLATGISETTISDPDQPAVGTGVWYLIRGRNACGAGSYGHRSDGQERLTTICH